jgi:hypothetical protein
MAETTAAPQIPPVDPKKLVDTAIAVLKNPTEFFQGIKGETGFQRCLTFSVVMSVVGGIISAAAILLWALIHGAVAAAIVGAVVALVQGVVAGLVVPFVGGIIVWIISMVFGSKAPWQASVPIAAYTSAISPIASLGHFIPVLGLVVGLAAAIYGIYICVMGARVINFAAPAAPAAG